MEASRRSASSVGQSVVPEQYVLPIPPPKVIGSDAIRNYIRSRTSTPNLIHGDMAAPNPHHHFRVKREGRANYERNQHSQMKTLFENYGKLPLPTPPLPHTQGEVNFQMHSVSFKSDLFLFRWLLIYFMHIKEVIWLQF